MTYPDILHHGGADGVTGSCHQLLMSAQHCVLVDCGLFQGEDAGRGGAGADRLQIEFALDTIKALVVTHVHIDHVGRIPYLLAAGFKGPILCSEPSARLLPLVLEDAFRLGISKDQSQVERYLRQIEQRIIGLPYKHWFTLVESEELVARVRLQRAGHILGSAYVEFDLSYPASSESKRVVFSGDLGATHAPLLPSPKPPYKADILVLESTYGDRNHESRANRRQRLKGAIEKALEDNGTVLIPAFSIGRTQELLYELEDIIHRVTNSAAAKARTNQPLPSAGRGQESRQAPAEANWPQLPIILDSPLASRFTEVYRQLEPFWAEEAQQRVGQGRNPLKYQNLLTVDSHDQHIAMVRHLSETARPAIIIAASGMCAGGRIVNYLKAMLGDPRHNVPFVGYQAVGTPGAAIQKYGPKGGYVELDGGRIDIKAGVESIGGYSAHADQRGLVSFAACMQHLPQVLRLVHGEEWAIKALADTLRKKYASVGKALIVCASVYS